MEFLPSSIQNLSKYTRFLFFRALPWDPNIGDEAGEMDSFVKYLIMRLRNSLVEKAGHYALEPGPLPEVKNVVLVALVLDGPASDYS
jgi:hypothetical protein